MECAVIQAGTEGQVDRVALCGADGGGGVALDKTPVGESCRFGSSECGAEDRAAVVERGFTQGAWPRRAEDLLPGAVFAITLTHGVADTGPTEPRREPGDCPPERIDDSQ